MVYAVWHGGEAMIPPWVADYLRQQGIPPFDGRK